MKIEDLPAAADPYAGESIYSWLEATRIQLGLNESEWRQWCGFSALEPERRIGGERWGVLPPELDKIERIPASWRIAAEWRRMRCSRCVASASGGTRHPVLVEWLDCRVIACARHRLLLSYHLEEQSLAVEDSNLSDLWQWLEQWRGGQIDRRDAKLRRDLLLASGRNWSPDFGAIASVEFAWAIEGSGWRLPKPQKQYRPLGPARIGGLGPLDRAAALLGAYRAWMALNAPSTPSLPAWPTAAWEWLARRWHHGGDERLYAMFTGIVAASRLRRR